MYLSIEEVEYILNLFLFHIKVNRTGDLSSALLNFWEGSALTESGKLNLYIHGANNHNESDI
jgi:DNA-directed RNA polymerase